VVLALANPNPWSSASFYLPSQSLASRKKERKQTPQTRDGTRTGSPPARAGFWKDDQGDRWGSPAPDTGKARKNGQRHLNLLFHPDNTAARLAVKSRAAA